MLNCPKCGLTNRPYEVACAECAAPLQELAAAEGRRREWDALPARLREEQERAYDQMREGTERHLQWLRRNRAAHAVLGSTLNLHGRALLAAGRHAESEPVLARALEIQASLGAEHRAAAEATRVLLAQCQAKLAAAAPL